MCVRGTLIEDAIVPFIYSETSRDRSGELFLLPQDSPASARGSPKSNTNQAKQSDDKKSKKIKLLLQAQTTKLD